MIVWTLKQIIISFVLIALVHYIYDFLKNNLTSPKVKDLVNKPNEQYKEIYKRFIIPFYIPILILTSLSLIIYSKESINYSRYRLITFLIGLFIIIFSETTLKFIQNTFFLNIKIMIIPIVIFLILYLLILFKTQKKLT